ncbi:MAG: hypothetical protein [Arizlama microvirus]|nr:MAG: hypothetical protein [Arizlama microvirus]
MAFRRSRGRRSGRRSFGRRRRSFKSRRVMPWRAGRHF